MKFELLEFQDKAARELLGNMTYLMDGYDKHHKLGSCCLAAPTGSGKTVIAAAVIEALLEGQTGYMPADPKACILWVTDLPSLADQTRFRLLEATDIDVARIETISNTFTQSHMKLEPGQVYFLHRQLLGKNKKLTSGGETRSFWQVLRDTINAGTHLYLFLDEAHRGLGAEAKKIASGDETIYAKIIDGEDGLSPIPVVVGISATPKRFLDAMANRQGRLADAPVTVSPADVQASGLLKDNIILRSPVHSAAASHMYLTDACSAFKAMCDKWRLWCIDNEVSPAVLPLMVVQVPDRVSDNQLNDIAVDIRSALPMLEPNSFAHVFGDHTDRHLGNLDVPYISPELVEGSHEIRVLFAKEAVSTGWDCPRAEVLISMRPHKDVTYITQLLGRMVRTPLAMRTEDDALNSVRCFLPEFDERSVQQVVSYLTAEDSADWSGISEKSGRHMFTDSIEAAWDHSLGVDEAFTSIRKRIESHHPTNEIEAAITYSGLLAKYEISMTEQKQVYECLLKELRTGIEVFKSEYEAARKDLSKLESQDTMVPVLTTTDADTKIATITQAADSYIIANARRRADEVFTEALTNRFFRQERKNLKSDLETNAVVAAAASVEQIAERVKKKARGEIDRLTSAYGMFVLDLSEIARAQFASALSANGIHRVVNLRIIESVEQDHSADQYVEHVLNDPSTGFAWLGKDSDCEPDVIKRELKRDGVIAFYRNPSSGTGDHVLSIVYQHPNGGHRTMHPDFIFFEDMDDEVMPAIVDPHGTHLVEAQAKLVGLVKYAQEFGDDFSRIWALNGDATYYLDILDPSVQDAILQNAGSVDALYASVGQPYD